MPKSFELLKLKGSSRRAGVTADLSITNAEDRQTGLGRRKLTGKAFDGHVIDHQRDDRTLRFPQEFRKFLWGAEREYYLSVRMPRTFGKVGFSRLYEGWKCKNVVVNCTLPMIAPFSSQTR